MKKITTLLLAVLMLTACSNKQNDALKRKGSSGKTLEVLVVADPTVYTGEVRDLIDSLFRAPISTLPQPEPRYSVVNIPRKSLENTQMFQMHRNIVVLDIAADNPNKTYRKQDQWASPQVVVELAANSRSALCDMLRKNHTLIEESIAQNEHERVRRAFYETRNPDLISQVKKKFGFALTLSEGYTLARNEEDFAWIRKETKDFSQALLIHVYPYTNEHQFDSVAILDRIDTMMRHYVPGPTEGSYMGLERRVHLGVDINMHKVDIPQSSYAIETRCLWRTFGDFMGGPCVCYTLLSPDNKQVVEIVGFVYCPRTDRYSKRDLLMQTEGIIYSIDWQ